MTAAMIQITAAIFVLAVIAAVVLLIRTLRSR